MKDSAAKVPNGVLFELKRFYYDTAQANHAGALAALTKLIPVSQVLFGTDYPLRPAAEEVDTLRDSQFSTSDLREIERNNALRLMPGLVRG